MNGFALLLAAAVLGVDYGWQPASDGRLEYIIQIEPITLIALREGQEVVSQIDPFVRDIRRFRIRVGTDVVPRVGTPVPSPAPTFSAASAAPPGVTYGWQPVNEQQVELIVQLSPERLTTLRNDPIVGEIPVELRSVARVRVRSGAVNLPRQNVPQTGPPVSATAPVGGPAPPGTRAPAPTAPSQTTYGTVAAGNPQAGQPSPANSPAFSSPNPANHPPAMSPIADPRSVSSSPPNDSRSAASPATGPSAPQYPASAWQTTPAQNSNSQPPNTSWQTAAGQNPAWAPAQPAAPNGQVAASSATTQPSLGATGPPGLGDPNGYRPSDGWSAPGGNYAGVQPPAAASQPWGTPDDRYTTERAPPSSYASAGAASNWGQVPPPSQSPSWPPALRGSQAQGEMASPFAASSTGSNPWSGTSPASAERPAETSGLAVNDTIFLGKTPKKKSTDFWENLADSADDSSQGFLREGSSTSDLANPDKPWAPLTLAMLALFASMGGNLYMGWIAVDVYRRYLEMADDGDDDEPSESPRRREDAEPWEDRPHRRERAVVED